MSNISQSLFHRKCPVCARTKIEDFSICEHRSRRVNYVSCAWCGLVFQNPTSTLAEWMEFYRTQYRLVYNSAEGPDAKQQGLQRRRAETYLSFVRQNISKPIRSHLDVGCSMGVLLELFKTEFGVTRNAGVEPGDAYRKYCIDKGISCVASLEDVEKDGGGFDIITLGHVLEHIADPVGFLRTLVDAYLAPDGYIFIEVPNVRGGWAMELAHPFCFSSKTLSDTLRLAGLQATWQVEHGRPKSSLQSDSRYIASLSIRSAGAIEPQAIKSVSRLYHIIGLIWLWKAPSESWLVALLKFPIRRIRHRIPISAKLP